MAKYYLGSVGTAEAFRRDRDGKLQLAFVSKTLTDCGINISASKSEVRAGTGAPVQFNFYHDPSIEITLTDILWKPEYLEAQFGVQFESGNEDYVSKEVNFIYGIAPYSQPVKKTPIPCGEEYLVWAAPVGTNQWNIVDYNPDTEILTLQGIHANKTGKFCVRHLAPVSDARYVNITSNLVPSELFLVVTAPLFASGDCGAARDKGSVGHITFEIPRFQLNGTLGFSFSMSQNQTMSLSGIALASGCYTCGTSSSKLMRIIEVITGRDWRDDVVNLIIDADTISPGDTPAIYAEKNDGSLVRCKLTDIIYRYGNAPDEPYTQMTDDYTIPYDVYRMYLNLYKTGQAEYVETIELPNGETYVAAGESPGTHTVPYEMDGHIYYYEYEIPVINPEPYLPEDSEIVITAMPFVPPPTEEGTYLLFATSNGDSTTTLEWQEDTTLKTTELGLNQ